MSSRNLLIFATVFILVDVATSSSSVHRGDKTHIHNVPSKLTVGRNDLIFVKVPTFIGGIQIREYDGVGVQFGHSLESKKNHLKKTTLALSNPPNCCIAVQNKLYGGAILVYRDSCSFDAKANNAKAAGASIILIINNDTDILKTVREYETDINTNIPTVILPRDAGEELEALLSNHSTVSVQFYSQRLPSISISEVFLLAIVVGTVLCSYYWSTRSATEVSLEQDNSTNRHENTLAEVADPNLLLHDKIAICEEIIRSLEEKMGDYECQVNALESWCKELVKCRATIADLDILRIHHDKALIEAYDQKRVLQNEIQTYTHTITAVKEMVDVVAQLVKLCKQEPIVDLFLTISSLELLKAASQPGQYLQVSSEGELGNICSAILYHTEVTIRVFLDEGLLAFENEVKMMSKFRHPNLATLIGACPEASALVYEHLPSGSLEDRLRCKGGTLPLSWKTRIKITAKSCSALIFLHSHGVTHGALRSLCVLLDSSFTCKIIDFRFSRKVEKSTSPEILHTIEADPSSDVYSFGLMLLELVTGKQGLSVAEEVKSCLDQGSLNLLLDTSAGEWPYLVAQQLAHLGLRCCNSDSRSRPDLASDVFKVLEPMRRSCTSALSSRVGEPPSYFVCPILLDVMENPHIAADGYTYEAEALKLWLDRGHYTSPMTNLPLDNTFLVPNRALHSAIQEWRQLQQQ